ncbi:tryptophan synthase alpha chain [Candidatus Kinetoplastibacterium desouzaii TCC079E]|uniref:Tryptophan synthase alpha chain n=1 Tax=Candidatus Kinetoplastidibacterium desouzai TCC079E TaxID=1208919 RepID=M1LSA7_9PROT|nr:tryptophan synthase subunit alpha [Candidatus Kinetoplastibacterium desouzaii]AGF47021.1 tryptophan synthase alpha chain [Candidatus Kinetoplastibacterium desouzaii TCC079E]
MKINRIDSAFSKLVNNGYKSALITYITAGDPSVESTVPLLHSLANSGVDILEIGIPFSDPMADGPVIQQASERAIRNGVGLKQVLNYVKEFRTKNNTTPVVLMGYANPIENMGHKNFVQAAKDAGVDGVLVVDYPPEESEEFSKLLNENGINMIFLLSPTSGEDRIKLISSIANGYVYYVSLKGVTGSKDINIEEVSDRLNLIKKHIKIPVGVGFGIRDAASAQQISKCADAVVIGSKLIEIIQDVFNKSSVDKKQVDSIAAASKWISDIKDAMNRNNV